jgi:cytochrome c biogenesis protein CcmG/thiol:disulfide interchange protein DsbE
VSRAFAASALFAGAAAALFLAAGGDERATVPMAGVLPPTPGFSLPLLSDPTRTLTETDLRTGGVTLLNVWATWCVPCRQEHGVLLTIAREHGVRIVGLNYRDARDDALRWLDRLGNPYAVVGHDGDGAAAHAIGVVGTPETYVIDAEGRIAHRHIGALTLDAWRGTLSPLVDELQARGTS